MENHVKIHQEPFDRGKCEKIPESPKISKKTVDIPIPNAYNNNVKMNRNSSGQGAADDAYSRPTV